jgi:RHS repeat-associated protein
MERAGDAVYTYDANGNLTSKTENGVATNFNYDVEDRLIQITDSSGSLTATYIYDPFGQRVSKTVNGTTTFFLYADEGLIAETDAAGNISKTYGWQPDGLWGTDPLWMRVQNSTTEANGYHWFLSDDLGTPQKLIATNGAVTWAATYDAFGAATVDTANSTVVNNLRFPGQYFDEETGLHWNWNRYYDPTTGRYITGDPINIAEAKDSYLYALNGPTSSYDPFGLFVVGPGIPGFGGNNPNNGGLFFGNVSKSVCHLSEPDDCEKLAQQIRSLQKGIRSLYKQIQIHQQKISDCLKNPNERCLQAINHWLKEIRTFIQNIQKMEDEIKRLRERMSQMGCNNIP